MVFQFGFLVEGGGGGVVLCSFIHFKIMFLYPLDVNWQDVWLGPPPHPTRSSNFANPTLY